MPIKGVENTKIDLAHLSLAFVCPVTAVSPSLHQLDFQGLHQHPLGRFGDLPGISNNVGSVKPFFGFFLNFFHLFFPLSAPLPSL